MTRDCWKDFAASGRVSDYLRYRKQERDERQQLSAAWSDGAAHGTDGDADRHGPVGDACR